MHPEVAGCRRSDGSLETSSRGGGRGLRCNDATFILTLYKSDRAGNSQDMSRRVQITFCIRYYLVKMYAARVQSTRSLLASPPCSAVFVTTLMLSLHSIDHYITICHSVVTLTTAPTCCLSPRQSSPTKILSYGAPLGGGGP